MSKDDQFYSIQTCEFNIYKWVITLPGPKGTFPSVTAYENGIFNIVVEFPEKYPFLPPNMQFTTSIYHPNIDQLTGRIELDVLDKAKWAPAVTFYNVMIELQSELMYPKVVNSNPLNSIMVDEFKNNRPQFEDTAREWTQRHAVGMVNIENEEEEDEEVPDEPEANVPDASL